MDELAVETLRTRIDGEVITPLAAEGLAAERHGHAICSRPSSRTCPVTART